MLEFERKTGKFIDRHSLIREGDHVLIAVSGGPDSLALLDFLHRRQQFYRIRIKALHVDHMLRGEESKGDLEFVRGFCEDRGIPFEAAAIRIKEKMATDRAGMQETARKYRYRFFEQEMHKVQGNKLAVAQHGDDQTETILMRLTRGSSGLARAGIQAMRTFASGFIIRPLLNVTKKDIEEYCAHYRLQPRRDPSNEKDDYTRNRFRHKVLPVLYAENPRVSEHFQRFSEEMTEDELYLESLAVKHLDALCQLDEHRTELDINGFMEVPLPLQRRLIHLILNYLYKQDFPDLSAVHANMVKRLIESENPSGSLDLPGGLKVRRSYGICIFTFAEEAVEEDYFYPLNPGESVRLPNGMVLELMEQGCMPAGGTNQVTLLDPDRVQPPFFIRTRRPGDRMQVKGMSGTKKIKEIFIEEKVPLTERKGWPIVTDEAGTILWLPGLKKSDCDLFPSLKQNVYVMRASIQHLSGGNQINEKRH